MSEERNWDKEDLSGWTVADLRDEGAVVVVFNPTELAGSDTARMEDRLTELGWELIEFLKT